MFKTMSVSNHVRVFPVRDSFKGYFSDMIIETHLELIEGALISEDIEHYTKAFGQTYWGNSFIAIDLQSEVMEIGRDMSPIANCDHLSTSFVPLDAQTGSFIYTQDGDSGSLINKYSQLVKSPE